MTAVNLPTLGRRPRRAARGFTLVEVLATLALVAIALPVIMQGIGLATATASAARHRTEAAALAESQLNLLVATGEWESGGAMTGDFSPDWPDYHWTAIVQNWQQPGLDQLDVHVAWLGRHGQEEIILSTLVYNGANASSSSSSSSSGSGTSTGSGASSGAGSSGGAKTGAGGGTK